MENPLFFKGKTTRLTSNQFTIIKSITIIFVYVSRLKKNLSYFSLLSHKLIISIKGRNTLLSPFYFSSPCTSLSWLFSFSKRLPFGCSFFFLMRLPLSLSLLYAAFPCCCSHRFLYGTLVFPFLSKFATQHEF